MTKIEFVALCGEYLIDPGLACESEAIRKALLNRDDEEVKRLLESEF